MTLKLGAIAAATGIATGCVQLFWSLASGSYNAGSRMESMQTELKLLRNEIQNQSKLYQAQNQIVEFRLSQLENTRVSQASNDKRGIGRRD